MERKKKKWCNGGRVTTMQIWNMGRRGRKKRSAVVHPSSRTQPWPSSAARTQPNDVQPHLLEPSLRRSSISIVIFITALHRTQKTLTSITPPSISLSPPFSPFLLLSFSPFWSLFCSPLSVAVLLASLSWFCSPRSCVIRTPHVILVESVGDQKKGLISAKGQKGLWLLFVSESGYGKWVPLSSFRIPPLNQVGLIGYSTITQLSTSTDDESHNHTHTVLKQMGVAAVLVVCGGGEGGGLRCLRHCIWVHPCYFGGGVEVKDKGVSSWYLWKVEQQNLLSQQTWLYLHLQMLHMIVRITILLHVEMH
ncbi:uncharacterized protein LOC127740560 [Arachis duranensis]|uniref:Uncharacterized protein LOC127740560 n=1 Tax=Arachis duranensis TaxID=130453 RepID=A0A9C6WJ46_ARADU|nr:uncharacterized protein LOC127740560 [Arachis duranensis]